MPAELLLLVAAAGLLAGALALLFGLSQGGYQARVRGRLQPDRDQPPAPGRARRLGDWVGDHLAGAGIEPRPWQGWLLFGGILVALVAGGHFQGPMGLLAAPLGVLALLYLVWAWRREVRARQLLEQLPGFMGHILRALRAGASLEQSLQAATAESDGVAVEAFTRILRQVRLGAAMDEALLRTADLYRLKELDMLALGVRVTQRYGGDLGAIMESISNVIRGRQQAYRELRAMTGETRLSAWVLAGLPVGLVTLILAINPNYLEAVLSTQGGRYFLIGAVVWQLIGLVLIRRMVKSV